MKKSNSAFFLPSILSSNKIKKQKSKNHTIYITLPDDMGFANKQIEKIEEILKKDKENEQKPWQKELLNIYKVNGKSNYQILKEFTQKLKQTKKDEKSKVNWSNQRYFNNKQVHQILDGNAISKRILEKINIQKRVRGRKVYLSLNKFVTQTKDVTLNNMKIKLIGKERIQLSQKEKDYENALNTELQSLEKDIDNFDKYKLEIKQRLKNDQIAINKLILKNKGLYEENKKLSHQYKFLVEEIIRYIKLIINLKTYASFVHTLLNEDTKIFNVNLNEYINYKIWTEKDLNKYIKKALNGLNLYLKEISLNENTLGIFSDNNRLEILFQIMENNILQVFKQREEIETEQKRIMEENKKQYDKLMTEYQNNKSRYDIYLTELKEEKKGLDKYNIDPELIDYFNEMNILLNDFCYYVVHFDHKKEMKKSMSELELTSKMTKDESGFFFRRDVKKCIEVLRDKQFSIQNLIDEIESYKNEDPELLGTIINQVKDNNRFERRKIEREKILKQELLKRENIIKKYRENILIQKFKFKEPIPFHIIKERRKYMVKYKPESTSTNLLFY